MNKFKIRKPPINEAKEIEQQSLALIEQQCGQYDNFINSSDDEKEVIKRLIHTTTQFDQIIDHIYFTQNAIVTIKTFLKQSSNIIVDTNMIKSGLSSLYTKKYNNNILCYVNDEKIKKEAELFNTTRSYTAVKQALKENKNRPVILVCGNAPTFLYSAIETFVTEDWPPENLVIIAMPVGFINVIESKNYTLDFLDHFGVQGIVLKDRYGGSALAVSCLHAIYKLLL